MPRSTTFVVKAVLFVAIGSGFAGCGFAPATPGGAGAASGGPLGAGNSSGAGLVGGGAAQNGQGAITGMNCAEIPQPLAKLPPDIVIVQDKSASMNDDPATGMTCNTPGCTKWEQTTAAITQVVTATQTGVNWGIKFFSSPGGGNCGVNPGVEVPIGANNANAVNAAIGNQSPSSNTPTRAAVAAAGAYLATLTDMNPKFLLLATDGLPNCPAGCSGNACSNTPNQAESAAAAAAVGNAASMGFNTFVVGIATASDPASDATLTAMANAGGVPRAGTPSYYPVSSQADLVAALNAIVSIAGSCIFTIPPPPNDMTDAMHIGVKIDGTELKQDTTRTNGWDYSGTNQVQIYGPSCDAIMSGAAQSVQIVFKCIVG